MSINQRNVYGTFNKPDGLPVVNGKITFDLGTRDGYNESVFISRGKTSVLTDNSGNFSVDLWINEEGADATVYRCYTPSGDTFDFILPAGSGSINLTVLRALSPPTPAPPNIQQIIEDYLAVQNGGTVTFYQTLPSTVWSVTHNLNRFPSVTTIDSAHTEIEGDVVYVDSNHITVTFAYATSGTIYLN
jgi:hypothetical protein